MRERLVTATAFLYQLTEALGSPSGCQLPERQSLCLSTQWSHHQWLGGGPFFYSIQMYVTYHCSQVRRYGPQFMFTVSGVDSLETRLQAAQQELGVPPSDWVPVMYKAQSDTLSVIHFLIPLYTGSILSSSVLWHWLHSALFSF